jgi:acyl-CoA synthetase (AMP-forming)/AMP-acid ligase II
MAIGMILEMAASMNGDRVMVGSRASGLTCAQLANGAAAGARHILGLRARHVAFIGVNSPAVPLVVFAAGLAGVPVTPLNYRLAADGLCDLVQRLDRPLLIVDEVFAATIDASAHAVAVMTTAEWLEAATRDDQGDLPAVDDDSTAVMLFTSGTTSAPKGVLLRHSHLVSYVLQTVEFGSAGEDEASLICLPPYHIAGIGAIMTNLFAGRRVVYLNDFTAAAWLDLVAQEQVTAATVVPTMLARIVEHLDGSLAQTPTLRSIAYGGSRMPRPILEQALAAFPDVDFTNAYGLTETSSTIAILGPDDHREAVASAEESVRSRLSSAGRFIPGIEGQIRDAGGAVLPAREVGDLWVRGAQVSGQYAGANSVLDDDGWFCTRDRGLIDEAGYLFIEGRADDTIIRGGENIAPAEIEEVLARHPDVLDVAVFGAPDDHWGARIVAALVLRDGTAADPERYRDWVRSLLRSSRTPDQIVFAAKLPYTATGKLQRRELAALTGNS